LGAVPDAFEMLPGIEKNFVPAREEGWPWALGVQHGCAHDYGNAAVLQIAWLGGIIAVRLPADADARAGVPKLREVKLEDGWLGDIGSVAGQWATIAPWKEFAGDRSRAAWFPNRAVAYVWRAWQTKESPVALEAAAADGSAALPAWEPKSARDLMVIRGIHVELRARAGGALCLKKVEFLDGDTTLGEVTAPPWGVTWLRPPQGPHAVHAIWEAEGGRRGAANPALIVIRAK